MFNRFTIFILTIFLSFAFANSVKLNSVSLLKKSKTQVVQKTYETNDHDQNPYSKRKFRKKAISEVAFLVSRSKSFRNFIFKPYIFHFVVNVGKENFESIRFKRGPPQC